MFLKKKLNLVSALLIMFLSGLFCFAVTYMVAFFVVIYTTNPFWDRIDYELADQIGWWSGLVVGLTIMLLCEVLVLAKPKRRLRVTLSYWYPRRLTLKSNPRIHAWLWWNF